jgi:hypothetical protein
MRKIAIVAMLALAVSIMASASTVFAAPFDDTGQPAMSAGTNLMSVVGNPLDDQGLIASVQNTTVGLDPGPLIVLDQLTAVNAAEANYICAPTYGQEEPSLNRDHSRVVASLTANNVAIYSGSSTPRQSALAPRKSAIFIGTLVDHGADPCDKGSPGPVNQDLTVESNYTLTRSNSPATVLRC